jgi:hypothetical protein
MFAGNQAQFSDWRGERPLPHPHRLGSFRGRQQCPTRPRLMPPARGPTGRHTSSADLTSHFIFLLDVYRPGGRLNHELCKRGKPSTTAKAQRTTGAGGTRTGSPSSRLSAFPHRRTATDITDLDPYLARAMDPEQCPRKPATPPCSAPGLPVVSSEIPTILPFAQVTAFGVDLQRSRNAR